MADQYDLELVERVAREMVEQRGSAAIAYLQDRAKIAEKMGDSLSANTWLDIAERVKGLLAKPRPGV